MTSPSAPSIRPATVAALSLLTWHYCGLPARANPTGGTVAQGAASFNSAGSQFTVKVTSSTAAIDWQSFNIGAGETTTFVQPSSTSVVWNQIKDANASQILGSLNANGYVILQNQNGFMVGGAAAISAHGLILTTSATPPPTLAEGGSWTFNAPPLAAKIVNFGQINVTGGGSAFLIANDIENQGTISAPGGKIGLYAGEQVLVSQSPDGLALSTPVTLPQGSVDNEGKLIADAGAIAAQAQTVNQNGLVQANTVLTVNGVVELVAGDSLTLGASSDVEAHGDNRPVNTAASSGGSVNLESGAVFADQSGSIINVSGSTAGGIGGQTAISAPQMTALNSSIHAQANAGFADGTLAIDTDNILLNAAGSPAPGALALNVNSLASGFSQIDLQASGNLELAAQWNLPYRTGQLNTVSLSAGDTLAVDSEAALGVPGGKIALNAATVTLDGTLQANTVNAANGMIDVVASGALSLGQNAVLAAAGDPTATGPSPGGFVVLQAGTAYNDLASSSINVAGAAGTGGVPGIVEIFGNNVTDATSLQSQIDGLSASQFNAQDYLLVNPYDITISTSPTSTASAAPTATTASVPANLAISDLNNYSQIDIHALDNIELQTSWTLTDPGSPAALNLSAGNSLVLDDKSAINAQNNWGVNLTAGTGFAPSAALLAPAAGSDGIYLNGNACVTTDNGNINVWAANEVQIATGAIAPVGNNGIRTLAGGNVTVTAEYGDVNTGGNAQGYSYNKNTSKATVSPVLGGISTVAGGNVTINAGGDVTSFLPLGSTSDGDGGTGAFGTEAGNVTINAGGNVYGHYVLANGVGDITAGQDIGISAGAATGSQFALSLIDGTWNINAPNGNIYLQEVRNPNGIFNTTGSDNSAAAHLFNYGPQAAVDLTAGDGVYLTGLVAGLPRPVINGQQDEVQVIYPPILDILAGAGGVNLLGPVTLFPSAYQSLVLTTTGGGDLTGVAGEAIPTELLMSDSSQTSWNGTSTITPFSDTDHPAGLPVQVTDPNPVVLNISRDMEYLNLVTSKATQITVGRNLVDCEFSGQNLAASDVTSITVGGAIENSSAYSSISGVSISSVPDADLLPGMSSSWNNIFTLAVNPAALANLVITPTTTAVDILEAASVFGVSVENKQVVGNTENFYYDQATGTLALEGPMNSTAYAALGTAGQSIYVLHLVNGLPQIGPNGQPVLDQVSWAPTAVVDALNTDSQNASPAGSIASGYRVGGPGLFDINAQSISLGDSSGLLSCGVTDPQFGLDRYTGLAAVTPSGATVNVTVTDDLTMLTSTIAALGGGDVNITSTGGSIDLGLQELASSSKNQVGSGIFTSGQGNVNVTAFDNVNIDGSRIATFNGGNIFIEALNGTVNVGSGSATYHGVYDSYVNAAGQADYYAEYVYGSGIVANTLVPPGPGQTWPLYHASQPGNITVEAPKGDIVASLGGITQEALDGNTAAGPVITLSAGTFPSGKPGTEAYFAGYPGSIDLGESGVIGGTVNATANGDITGLIISRQNTSVNATLNVNVSILAVGKVDVTGGLDVSGLIVGGQGVDSKGENVTALELGQNVVDNGGTAHSTLGATATATSASQSAANQAVAQAKAELANDDGNTNGDQKKKNLLPVLQRVKRVTVILPDKT